MSTTDRLRRYYTLRFLLGVGILLGCGAGLPGAVLGSAYGAGNYIPVDVGLGVIGFWLAFAAVTPLVRCWAEDRRLRAQWGRAAHDSFTQGTTPQQVFLLLLGVAEASGTAGPAARELVRRFVQHRFAGTATADSARAFAEHGVPTPDLAALARRVARGLDFGERSTLFSWSCLVLLAGGDPALAEHPVLLQVGRGLGLTREHARLLFLLAQQAHSANRGAWARKTIDGRREAPPPRREARHSERERALQTLDLPAGASREQIRRRHRELVRRFHPDAQPNLGPIAQQEATDRFRAIQRAYETLTA